LVGHPLLEVVLAAPGLDRRPHVRQAAERELDGPELPDDVGALERVVEVAPAPEDARHARTHEELVAHDLEPEVVDLLVLREEAVAAEVEAVPVRVDDGLRDAADLVVGLEHDDPLAGLRQLVPRRQAGRAPTHHDVRRVISPRRADGRELSGRCHASNLPHTPAISAFR
jgi:hypothetical protein